MAKKHPKNWIVGRLLSGYVHGVETMKQHSDGTLRINIQGSGLRPLTAAEVDRPSYDAFKPNTNERAW